MVVQIEYAYLYSAAPAFEKIHPEGSAPIDVFLQGSDRHWQITHLGASCRMERMFPVSIWVLAPDGVGIPTPSKPFFNEHSQ
jgi:hypothetical protein